MEKCMQSKGVSGRVLPVSVSRAGGHAKTGCTLPACMAKARGQGQVACTQRWGGPSQCTGGQGQGRGAHGKGSAHAKVGWALPVGTQRQGGHCQCTQEQGQEGHMANSGGWGQVVRKGGAGAASTARRGGQ